MVDIVSLGARDKDWACKPSEDRHVITHNMIGIIDGATSVNPTDRYGQYNPAEFAAEFLACYARHYSFRDESAEQMMKKANTALRRVLERYHSTKNLDFVAGPSAAASFVKFHHDGTFDAATASDTVVCARTLNGEWLQLTQDLLAPARKQMEAAVNVTEAGIPDGERAVRAAKLKDARFRREYLYNKGSAVFNGDPRFETSGLIQTTGALEAARYSHLVIMSDGAFDPKTGSPLDTCKRLEARKMQQFCPHVVAGEIFAEKESARGMDLGGKSFDDLTMAIITMPEALQ